VVVTQQPVGDMSQESRGDISEGKIIVIITSIIATCCICILGCWYALLCTCAGILFGFLVRLLHQLMACWT